MIDMENLRCIKHNISTVQSVHSSVMFAKMFGHLAFVQELNKKRQEILHDVATAELAANGNIDMIKWLHEHAMGEFSCCAMNQAACHGHLDVVQYLYQSRTEGYDTWVMNLAASRGQLHVIKWFHENRTEGCAKHRVMEKAAIGGHLKVKFLQEVCKMNCTKLAMNVAAKRGHYGVVEYICEKRFGTCSSYRIMNVLTDEIAEMMVASLSDKQIPFFWNKFYEDPSDWNNCDKIHFKDRYDALVETQQS